MKANIKKAAVALAAVALLAFVGRELFFISKASAVLASATILSKKCDAGEKFYCTAAVSTIRNLEAQLRFIPASLEANIVDAKSLAQLRNEILPRIEPKAQIEDRELEEERQALTNLTKELTANLSEVQKAQQQDVENLKLQYNQLAAPKLLYKCGNSITLTAGSGVQNYNDILARASANCSSSGNDLTILNSEK